MRTFGYKIGNAASESLVYMIVSGGRKPLGLRPPRLYLPERRQMSAQEQEGQFFRLRTKPIHEAIVRRYGQRRYPDDAEKAAAAADWLWQFHKHYGPLKGIWPTVGHAYRWDDLAAAAHCLSHLIDELDDAGMAHIALSLFYRLVDAWMTCGSGPRQDIYEMTLRAWRAGKRLMLNAGDTLTAAESMDLQGLAEVLNDFDVVLAHIERKHQSAPWIDRGRRPQRGRGDDETGASPPPSSSGKAAQQKQELPQYLPPELLSFLAEYGKRVHPDDRDRGIDAAKRLLSIMGNGYEGELGELLLAASTAGEIARDTLGSPSAPKTFRQAVRLLIGVMNHHPNEVEFLHWVGFRIWTVGAAIQERIEAAPTAAGLDLSDVLAITDDLKQTLTEIEQQNPKAPRFVSNQGLTSEEQADHEAFFDFLEAYMRTRFPDHFAAAYAAGGRLIRFMDVVITKEPSQERDSALDIALYSPYSLRGTLDDLYLAIDAITGTIGPRMNLRVARRATDNLVWLIREWALLNPYGLADLLEVSRKALAAIDAYLEHIGSPDEADIKHWRRIEQARGTLPRGADNMQRDLPLVAGRTHD